MVVVSFHRSARHQSFGEQDNLRGTLIRSMVVVSFGRGGGGSEGDHFSSVSTSSELPSSRDAQRRFALGFEMGGPSVGIGSKWSDSSRLR